MLPPKRSSASRLLPCLHYIVMQIQMFWNSQTGNSRGQRTVDSIIMYQNYGVPTKSHFFNLEDKQLVFPEDDDSDIIIVNEDYNRNVIRNIPVESLQDLDETTTEHRFEALDAHEYVWKTTDWSPCSALCSKTGHQIRGAVCQHKKDNSTTTVETEECLSRGGTPPTVVRECEGESCAEWKTAPWSVPKCLSSGAAIVRRRVECVAENGTTLAEGACDSTTRPEKTKRDASPCRAAWAVGPWSKCVGLCSSVGRQHRALRCVWRALGARRRGKERSAAAACEGLQRPRVTRPCQVHACVNKDGICRDSSRFCENVRAMNMCALKRYRVQCCKTCSD